MLSALLVAALAAQDPPALKVAIEERTVEGRPLFRIQGTSRLPADARVRVDLTYGPARHDLAIGRNLEVGADGSFSTDVTAFPKSTFPGTYFVTARAPLPLQPAALRAAVLALGRGLQDDAQCILGKPEDVEPARRAYLDELSAAFTEMEKIRGEILGYPVPGDAGWSAAAARWQKQAAAAAAPLQGRRENAILKFGEPYVEGFHPAITMLAELMTIRRALKNPAAQKAADALGRQFDRHRHGYLHALGSSTDQLRRAADLLNSLARRLEEGTTAEAQKELLELDGLLPRQAHETVAALAALLGEEKPDRARVQEQLTLLAEWVKAVAPPGTR